MASGAGPSPSQAAPSERPLRPQPLICPQPLGASSPSAPNLCFPHTAPPTLTPRFPPVRTLRLHLGFAQTTGVTAHLTTFCFLTPARWGLRRGPPRGGRVPSAPRGRFPPAGWAGSREAPRSPPALCLRLRGGRLLPRPPPGCPGGEVGRVSGCPPCMARSQGEQELGPHSVRAAPWAQAVRVSGERGRGWTPGPRVPMCCFFIEVKCT